MMRLRSKSNSANSKPESDEKRRTRNRERAIKQWEKRLVTVQNGETSTTTTTSATSEVGRRPRSTVLRRARTEGLQYVDVSNSGSDSEGEDLPTSTTTTRTPHYVQAELPAKRLQQLEQAQAMSRFFESLGGREA